MLAISSAILSWPVILCSKRVAQLIFVLVVLMAYAVGGVPLRLMPISTLSTPCETVTFEVTDGHRFILTNSSTEFSVQQTHFATREFGSECLEKCRTTVDCLGVNYNGRECRLWHLKGALTPGASIEGVLERVLTTDEANSTATTSVFARKLCITDRHAHCQDKEWAFEHLPGFELTSTSDSPLLQRKTVISARDLDTCAQLCLDESAFQCRSAQFNAGTLECTLMSLDRHTLDNNSDRSQSSPSNSSLLRFERSAHSLIHYLENQCIEESRKFCDFHQLKNHRLLVGDSTRKSISSLSECREVCLAQSHCRIFQYNSTSLECLLSHFSEASARFIPNLFQIGAWNSEDSDNSAIVKVFEVATCYNVSIECGSKSMSVHISTSRLFSGKIYPRSQPRRCVRDVTNQLNFSLSMPYLNDAEHECDTRQTEPGSFVNDIVIQHHDLVLTTRDLSVGVHCRFDLRNDSVARVDLKIQGDILTERIKGQAELPDLSLHVVDAIGNDIEEVNVGDLLRVQVKMSDEETYGIFVRNLIARDSSNPANNFTLIDGKGCPLHVKMFREMRRMDAERKSLESFMEAFTFTGNNLLFIEAEVETCLDKCRPMQCLVASGRSNDHTETVTSYGRRRRRRRRSIVTEPDGAEKGDVLSMTMLTKSLLIRSRRETMASDDSGNNNNNNNNNSTTRKQQRQPKQPSLSSIHSRQFASSSSPSSSHQAYQRRPSMSQVQKYHNQNHKTSEQKKTFSHFHRKTNRRLDNSPPASMGAELKNNRAGYYGRESSLDTAPHSQTSPLAPLSASSSSSSSPPMRHRPSFPFVHLIMGNKNFVCFEPLNLVVVCAFSLCAQGALFTFLFYCFTRGAHQKSLRRTIASPTGGRISESSSHLYFRQRPAPYRSIH